MSGESWRATVLARLARYLAGQATVDQLEASLPDVWELEELGDEDLERLVWAILGALSEYRRGDLVEPKLRSRLEVFVPWAVVVSHSESEFRGTPKSVVRGSLELVKL
jgi:hypothetical protein